MAYLARKTDVLCSKCDNSWINFCKRYPDIFENRADGGVWFIEGTSSEEIIKHRLQYNKYSENCKVSGVEFSWYYDEPLYLCMKCLRDFLDGPAVEI